MPVGPAVCYAYAFPCGHSFTVCSSWGRLPFLEQLFSVFSLPPLPMLQFFVYFYLSVHVFFHPLLLLLLTLLLVVVIISTALVAFLYIVTGAWVGAGLAGRAHGWVVGRAGF